jgi:TPR repeat protein
MIRRLRILSNHGRPRPQTRAESVRWYRLAADQGNAKAPFNLGGCYALGAGVARDEKKALRWYRLAAEQGGADAETALAQVVNLPFLHK